jgi:hypothetical protein
MFRYLIASAALVGAMAATVSPAAAESHAASFLIKLTVPVICRVGFTGGGAGAGAGGAVDLGQVKEYCNDGAGYAVIVDYAPGTLRGAVLQLGDDHVTLDGSGEAVISQAPGPRIRSRELLATPGANGFDTDALSFQMRPTA